MTASEAIKANRMDGFAKQFEWFLGFFNLPPNFPGVSGIETAFKMGWSAAMKRAAIIAEQEENK